MKAHYIRVSTIEQNTDRQELKDDKDFIQYMDKISGSVPFNERPAGSKLFKDITSGKITEVHVHSIDRLGRNTLDILQSIQSITALGCNLISKKEGLQTLINGKENPLAKMLIGILSTLSEFELNRIRERQLEGISKAKERDVYVNNRRPVGSNESREAFLNKPTTQKIIKCLKQNRSVRESAKIAGCSPTLVQKTKKLLEI